MVQTPRGYNKGGIKALEGKTPTLSSSSWEHNNHLVIPMKDKSFCIDANYHKGTSVENYLNKGRRQLVPDNTKIRKLTPTECERLQGVPD